MARSIDEIYNSILVAKRSRTELDVLSSPSATAIWRLWAYITALAHYTLEVFFDSHKAEVESILARKQYGTPTWFSERSLEFQLGDQLTEADGRIFYPVVSPAKRIITRVAYKEGAGLLTLKVAKGGENAEPLSADELQQYSSYVEKIKPAGLQVNPISLNADKLRITGTVYFDGIYDPADTQNLVTSAVASYMASLPFNGVVYRNAVIDAVQRVRGVVDFELTGLDLVQGATVVPVGRVAETASGYLVADPATAITYSADVQL